MLCRLARIKAAHPAGRPLRGCQAAVAGLRQARQAARKRAEKKRRKMKRGTGGSAPSACLELLQGEAAAGALLGVVLHSLQVKTAGAGAGQGWAGGGSRTG